MSAIILTGGGTAGHIMPHTALLPRLKKSFNEIYFIGGGKKIESDILLPLGIPCYHTEAPALKRSLDPQNLLIPIKLIKAVAQAKKLIEKMKPDVVFSKGGYCSLPVCIAASAMKIPLVCHESDISPGLANRLISGKCKRVFTTFKETANKNNYCCCGPILPERLRRITKLGARQKLSINSELPVLLITGGSQGSAIINDAVWKNLDSLRRYFYIIHLYGKGKKCPYSTINGYLPLEFGDMNYCLAAADICLSRGGSNTLFEIILAKKPALIAPLVKGSRGDQIKNAEYFASKELLETCSENLLNSEIVTLARNLYKNRSHYTQKLLRYRATNGVAQVADYLATFVNYKNNLPHKR